MSCWGQMPLWPDPFCAPPNLTWESFCGRHPNGFYVSVLCPHNIGWHSPQSEKTQRRDPHQGFPGGSEGKVSACNAGDLGLILGSGRSPGEGNSHALQYSCLDNHMDRRAWQAISPWSHKESDSTNTFTFFYFLVAAYTPGPIPL